MSLVKRFTWRRKVHIKERAYGGSYFTKSNGESYLEDYLDFLEKLGPLPGETTIGEIIAEEAEAYFNGTKDAGQTAAVIENRVQLYLDE